MAKTKSKQPPAAVRRAAAAQKPATTGDDFVPAAVTPRLPTILKAEPIYFAGVRLELSDGTNMDLIAAGNGSNAENAAMRDRLVQVLNQHAEDHRG